MFYDLVHGDSHMALFVDTLAIPYHEYLGRLVWNIKHLYDLVRNVSIGQEVKEIEVYI
jgi:hypothetical protein